MRQLTLGVNEVAEAVRELGDGTEAELVVGTIKVRGELRVPRDLQRREDLTVTIADLDGEVIAAGRLLVSGLAFVDIEDHGTVIGVERRHTAKVVE